MNSEEKQEFIKSLLHTMEADLLKMVPRMPEEWDGVELRWLIADAAAYHAGFGNRERRAEYKNTIAVLEI